MRFLEDEKKFSYQDAKFAVLPVPHEETTSYGKGTRNGPVAILRASRHLETFDNELGYDPFARAGIFTFSPVPAKGLAAKVTAILKDGKIPIILGGEHSITPLALPSFAREHKNLSVLHLDAHADLRDTYQGKKNSHACAMRRALEICPVVQAGIRSLSSEEDDFAKKTGQIKKIHWADRLELVEKIENQLSGSVYLSIDVDVFDPSIIPATGTPEPGGMLWHEVLDILARVCRDKKIVGLDVVELAPIRGITYPDFSIAKLIYKIIGFILSKEG